ncbi:rho GTPase-activating protein 20-like [Ochotona princeps]|uniref:rho GTPase-activating protein 20-like n=1 Tax=Ochotona princeps TaxID=9978 RepID=UPI002714DFAF|nr:rho GTPase-activating protein 20-like [Ochotona princeps]
MLSTQRCSNLVGQRPKVPCTSKNSSAAAVNVSIEKVTLLEGVALPLMIHGPVTLKSGQKRKKYQIFLYSNTLLLSNSNYKACFITKCKVPVSNLWMSEDGVDPQGKCNACDKRSFFIGWPMLNFVATFNSSVTKEKWYTLLQRNIISVKEDDYSRNILIKIITEDINSGVTSTIITVTNLDTTNDVINLSLPILGLTGSVRDYQLWVAPAKEEAPQPLSGHENPFTIQRNYIRSVSLPPTSGKSTSPSNPQESVLKELYSEVCGWFILKPRCQAKGQNRSDGRLSQLFRWNAGRRGNDLTQGAAPPH